MIRWIRSEFAAVGPDAEIERFRLLAFRTVRQRRPPTRRAVHEVVFDFGAICPMPTDLEGASACEWASVAWGTTANARGLELIVELAGVLEFAFVTPDRFPEPIFRSLAAEFPELVFDGRISTSDGATLAQAQFNGSNRWRSAGSDADGWAF